MRFGLGLGLGKSISTSLVRDPLAGIPFAARFQTTYLEVEWNDSVNGGAGGLSCTTKDIYGNQLLWQDAAGTIPAINADDIVMRWDDPKTGVSAIQTNTVNAPTLQFAQNANGIWVPYLDFTAGNMLNAGTTGIPTLPIYYVFGFAPISCNLGYSGLICGKDVGGLNPSLFNGLTPSLDVSAADDSATIIACVVNQFTTIRSSIQSTGFSISNGLQSVSNNISYSDDGIIPITIGDRVGSARQISMQLTSVILPLNPADVPSVFAYAATLNP